MKTVAARQLWCSGKLEFCCAEMSFFVIGLLCMSEKNAFIANQKNFISRNFTNFTQSRFFTHKKLLLHVPFFAVRKKFPFSQTKSFLFTESLRTALKSCPFTYKSPSFTQVFSRCPQKPPFLRTKSLLFAQTFPYCYPKQPFSALRLPFAPPLTYCPQRIQLFF